MWIKNLETLLSNGNKNGRRVVLEVIEAGLEAADPYNNTRKLLTIENEKLIIGHKDFDVERKGFVTFDLSEIGSIYVLGGGKAAQRISKGIEDVLGDRITGGAINAKKGEEKYLKRIDVTLAGHPIPDDDSVRGAKRIVEIAEMAKEGDLVFCVTSGGCSSLVTLPVEGLSLEDIKNTTRIMQQEHGVPTRDLNVVRGHLSSVKYGRVATLVYPATMVFFMLGSGLGHLAYDERDNAAYIFHPGSRPSSFNDAVKIVKKWGAWDEIPTSVRAHLENADTRYKVPKTTTFTKMDIHQFGVMNSRFMLEGAIKKAEDLGLTPILFPRIGSTVEARELGKALSAMALQIEGKDVNILANGTPFKTPCILISNGESIVTVGKGVAESEGGRNQEFVLSSALRISGSRNITVASVDSDGTDGPTNVAGGVADGYTAKRAEDEGVNIFKALKTHNTTSALRRLNDVILTGNTGTNLMDLRVIYIN